MTLGLLGSLFREALGRKEKLNIYGLGLMMERGEDALAAELRRDGIPNPEKILGETVEKILDRVSHLALEQNDSLIISAQIGMLRRFREMQDIAGYLGELERIFPPLVARALFLTAKMRFLEQHGNQTAEQDFADAMRRHEDERRAFMAPYMTEAMSTPRDIPETGTPNRMVSCPKCDEPKRCFPSMKRFKCKNPRKNCGFESAFDFHASNPLATKEATDG